MRADLRDIPIDQFNSNVFKLWDKDWLALTSGDYSSNQFNAMTVAWGSFGIMWNKPFVMVVVRPTRHTFNFINQYETFSLCAFPEDFRKSLNILGSQSGRDIDKVKAAGLTPIPLDKIAAPGYAEADLIFQCSRIFWEDFDRSKFLDASIENHYVKKDYHRMIFGEVLGIHADHEKYCGG
jgi:flavin reductase (DIM6/NTAB) family NADH-FMN oxidoreductase RutF